MKPTSPPSNYPRKSVHMGILLFYAHADVEEICHCMAHRRRASREDGTFLLDCAGVRKEISSFAARVLLWNQQMGNILYGQNIEEVKSDNEIATDQSIGIVEK